jgi:tetratricopeptide (TPR) repeat protein
MRRQEITARVVDHLDPRFGRDPDMVAFLSGFLAGGAPPRDRGDLLWMRFFGGATRAEPLALLLDDAHFGEFETMDLVGDLAVRAREHGWPLLLVIASRPADDNPRAQLRIVHLEEVRRRLAMDQAVQEHSLEPLGEKEVADLLDATFPGNTFRAEVPFLAAVLASQTEGNPFFLGETFGLLRRAVGADGVPLVAPGPGGWTVSPALREEELAALIPQAADEVVEARLRQLDESVVEVLQWAAVIGEEFEVDLLATLGGGMDRIDAALEVMERARLVRATDGALTRYRFSHSILPHVVERRVADESPRRLRRLHGAVADALQEMHGKRGAQRLSLRLSRHLLHAGRRREAFRALVAAAGRLVKAQLFPRARSTLAHAERLIEEGLKPSRAQLRDYHLHRGETARILGQYEVATESFQSAIEIASSSGSRSDRTLLAVAYSKLGKVHEVRGQLTDALYCYGVGMGLREESGDRTGLASSLVNIGTAYALTGEHDRAREYLDRALEMARRTRNRRARANAEVQRGFLAAEAGDLDAARAAYRTAHGLFRTEGDRRGQSAALNGVGNVALRRGNLPRAERAYRRSLELRRAVGDREGMASSFNNLGVVAERRRDPAGAISWYRRSLAVHRYVGSRRGIAGVSRNLGVAQLLAGDARSALGALSESVAEWRALGDKAVLSEVLVMQGRALRAAGEAAESEAAVEEAVRVAEASGSRAARGRARAARSEILVESGRASVARVLLEMEETSDLPGDVAALVAHAQIEALLQTEVPAATELAEAFDEADAAVKRAVDEGADVDVPVRLLLQRGRWHGLAGLDEEAVGAYREAATMATSDRRPPGPLLLAALKGVARWSGDDGERSSAEERAVEIADLLRTKGGGEPGEPEVTGAND